MRFKNTNVLVLGGAGNIGKVITKAFSTEGAKVFVHGLHTGDYQSDLSDENSCDDLVKNILTDSGGIDIFINSVGAPLRPSLFEETTWNDVEEQLVQLKSGFCIFKKLLPHMKEKKWGRVVNIITANVEGQIPSRLTSYFIPKFGLLGFTKSIAKEVARYGITVNAVSPGYVPNKFSDVMPEKTREVMEAKNPFGRLTKPEDVAMAVLFFSSREADYITGQNLVVDGGSVL